MYKEIREDGLEDKVGGRGSGSTGKGCRGDEPSLPLLMLV